MTAAATPDFVDLQLTAAGIAFAGKGASVRFSNGHYYYSFTPGKSVKVLSSEWRRGFPVKTFNGKSILEEVTLSISAATVPAAPAPAKAAVKSRTFSPAVSHTDAPTQPVTITTQPAASTSAAQTEVK